MAKAKTTTTSKPMKLVNAVMALMAPIEPDSEVTIAVIDPPTGRKGWLVFIPVGDDLVLTVTEGSKRDPKHWANAMGIGKTITHVFDGRLWKIWGLRCGSDATPEEDARLFGKASAQPKDAPVRTVLS